MKKILSVLVLCLLSILPGCAPRAPRPEVIPQVSIQRKAAHLISFKGRNADNDIGFCTGTVVGSHAIMTADHCDIAAGASDTISIDLATQVYHIQKRWTDNRDHIIYGLDGPAFEDISEIHQRPAKEGEYVYYYGDPEGSYPPKLFRGQVKFNHEDVSEVDRKAGIGYYILDSYPGCSGSAVYGADGAIVGLITYGDDDDEFGGLVHKRASIGFALNFSDRQLAEVAKFKPSKHPKVKAPAEELPRLFPF